MFLGFKGFHKASIFFANCFCLMIGEALEVGVSQTQMNFAEYKLFYSLYRLAPSLFRGISALRKHSYFCLQSLLPEDNVF